MTMDYRDFEAQKNITCDRDGCKFKFGRKLLCGSDTFKEYGGCPKCYYEFVREQRMTSEQAIEENLKTDVVEKFQVPTRFSKGIEVYG